MKNIVYLDMDGVLTNFAHGALKTHSVDHLVNWYDMDWGFTPAVAVGAPSCDTPAFWSGMGHDFWANLDWTDEGRELLQGLESIIGADNIVLMSSPCETPGGVEGKISWIKKHVPRYKRDFFIGPPKYKAAAANKILVDDHKTNVDLFREHGGAAVMVPRPWNPRSNETHLGRFNVVTVLTDLEKLL